MEPLSYNSLISSPPTDMDMKLIVRAVFVSCVQGPITNKDLSTHQQGVVLLTDNQHKMVICRIYVKISKVYRNGLSMFGRLIMCTVYTNKFTFGQLKLRLGI